MLENTFCHVPGIGPKTERRLWRSGVCCWRDALERRAAGVSPARTESLAASLRESVARLDERDARYFHERLPSRESWRMFPAFRDSVAYVDIETTGLGGPGDYITTIALYDGRRVRTYVHGENLEDFRQDIADYRLVVTYNGKTFDFPFIRNYFGLAMNHAHVDLRYVLHSLGFSGGLKGCERQLGLDRGDLDGIDGYFAVLLWRDFRRSGDERALQTLLAYNAADVVNLEVLMVRAYNMKVADTLFAGTHSLDCPASPELPFQPDMPTVERIRREHGFF